MTPQDLDRFRQAWSSGDSSTGHGLGLAICHEMAAQHGLTLSVTSTPGQGTVFSLRIPPADVVKGGS